MGFSESADYAGDEYIHSMTIRIRRKLFQAGITRIAEALPERAITKMQFSSISTHSNDVTTRIFASGADAEAWLDEPGD